ncbi:simple sugar transport system ATP-binding protein [Caminicella sporogenes DSM 14501]|uniref:Simple sugar transport system ATP-binding protein n=1 Tax=Caminicella sporogenes DSM 14501 TaxID=1121266 RepID=A0A1M6MLR5_9FIRM|nr:ABC transporter ATP-binding protein [Caminicella sporogenes]RKD27497.1 heme ABC transporter ATP-binding protein [Caminicella sporogenes]WIF94931.1 ABC transporter ATP-binding protein [Caminicella sporogenes]SHJ84364.1 simple sugar transport system ATP-binding protein [Caminicella sporogenes DSM 14501]
MEYIIEMLNIRKEFPGIVANDNITLQVKPGEIHALLGENGAGKSTLMSVLFGLYKPDRGEIRIRGQKVNITNPNVANELGIGMVHQHFKLVHNFTVTENIILGQEPTERGRINIEKAAKKIKALSEQYGLDVDPYAKIEDITVGMQQRVEILKMLYRDAEILIFDEPTAALTPQEITELIEIMKRLVKEGKSIILITHKLKEIKAVADRCTIIRRGKYIDTVDVKTTSEEKLASLMVGREVSFKVEKKKAQPKEVVLKIENLVVRDSRGLKAVDGLNLEIRSGEILGIAGVDGNGQTELLEAIAGLRKVESGKIELLGKDITNMPVRKRTELGIGHIPQDRHKHGLVLDFKLGENMVLQTYYKRPYSKNGILNESVINKKAEELIEEFDVRCGQGTETITRAMSGGNQQKAIIAREVDRSPALLIAGQPTRGLDVGAIEFIHKKLVEERDKGKAVLLVSLELDEVMNVSDRIAVIFEGKIVGMIDADKATENQLGLMMAGSSEDKKEGDR